VASTTPEMNAYKVPKGAGALCFFKEDLGPYTGGGTPL